MNCRHDTQLNDIHHNDTQHVGLISDTQHNNTAILLNVALYCYAECRYAECRGDNKFRSIVS
jgi:hypothetical protein